MPPGSQTAPKDFCLANMKKLMLFVEIGFKLKIDIMHIVTETSDSNAFVATICTNICCNHD